MHTLSIQMKVSFRFTFFCRRPPDAAHFSQVTGPRGGMPKQRGALASNASAQTY